MKKNLLSFSMLVLSIGLSVQTFAQGDSGGSSSPGSSVTGGVTTGVTTVIAPPAGVRSVKRNNGDASSMYGVAEARLNFTRGMDIGNPELVKVTYLSDGTEIKNAVMLGMAVVDWQKSYISYSLTKNVNPAKKLLFHFQYSNGTGFTIPETN
jgi:hypothetical protein